MSLIESFHQTITEDGPRRGIYPPQVAAIHFTFYLFFTKERGGGTRKREKFKDYKSKESEPDLHPICSWEPVLPVLQG